MKILAIMQNQWFKNPESARRIMDHAEQTGKRNEIIARFLFRGCLTGKRLRLALGEELCNRIVWEEASRNVGGVSSSAFPADVAHIVKAIELHRPDVVLAFGNIATNGVAASLPRFASKISFRIIGGPHPAARHATVMDDLRQMKESLLNPVEPTFYPAPSPGEAKEA